MTHYKFDPNHVHKHQNQKLFFTSTDPDKNEVFEFEGLSSDLLSKLIVKQNFTFETALLFLQDSNANVEDLDTLWKFCLERRIIIPAN